MEEEAYDDAFAGDTDLEKRRFILSFCTTIKKFGKPLCGEHSKTMDDTKYAAECWENFYAEVAHGSRNGGHHMR